jgi:hypothetical protein
LSTARTAQLGTTEILHPKFSSIYNIK